MKNSLIKYDSLPLLESPKYR